MKYLYIEENENIPAIIVSESIEVPTGFYNGGSIFNWDKYWLQTGLNWSQIRRQIQEIVMIDSNNLANWAGLSLSYKEIACKWCVVPYSFRVPAIVNEEEDKANWSELLFRTLLDRKAKIERMRQEMGDDLRKEVLSNEDSNNFYKDTKDMLSCYEFTSNPEFKQWLEGVNGEGFSGKSYYTEDRRIRLLGIYNS